MSGVLEFAAARIGRHVASPGGEGGQCVDLVELWAIAEGRTPIPGNAVDLFTNASAAQWRKVANGPTNFPQPRDIVVWGPSRAVGIGVDGHTAVCLAADSMWLLSLDQNWPEGAPVSVVLHTYAGVVGWLAPISR